MQYRTTAYAADQYDTYYFEKNLQGDIIAVYTADGKKIGGYTYDAWGNCTASVTQGTTSLEQSIVNSLNPFRYRGYYYDTETGLYYLQSRYYDPAMGRFLNADGFISTGTGLLGYNMYAYCNNNPVMYVDPTGTLLWELAAIILIGGVLLSTTGCADPEVEYSDDAIMHDVPLYDQGDSDHCGLYCQAMAEAYANPLEDFDLDKRINELIYEGTNGQYTQGGVNPTNRGTPTKIMNIYELYNLIENGPVYASYRDYTGAGHMVLVTGVDYQQDIICTNNPWGVRGTQSFKKFQQGFVTYNGETVMGWELEYIYPIKGN